MVVAPCEPKNSFWMYACLSPTGPGKYNHLVVCNRKDSYPGMKYHTAPLDHGNLFSIHSGTVLPKSNSKMHMESGPKMQDLDVCRTCRDFKRRGHKNNDLCVLGASQKRLRYCYMWLFDRHLEMGYENFWWSRGMCLCVWRSGFCGFHRRAKFMTSGVWQCLCAGKYCSQKSPSARDDTENRRPAGACRLVRPGRTQVTISQLYVFCKALRKICMFGLIYNPSILIFPKNVDAEHMRQQLKSKASARPRI